MGAQGNTTVDFGVFPGVSDTTVTITGQAGIVADSCVEAWVRGEASADHSSDEHVLETIKVVAKDIVAGTGFTIHAVSIPFPTPRELPAVPAFMKGPGSRTGTDMFNGDPHVYGVFNVSWVWN